MAEAAEASVAERARTPDQVPAALGSALHGPRHWRAVARVGAELARRTPGADPDLVLLFAFAHDTRRRHDGHDPDHGRRAAAAVRELAAGGALDLDPARLALLCRACAGHADGSTSADPTVGACWDADRLNLWRVGLAPARGLLSTAASRSAEFAAAHTDLLVVMMELR